MCRPIQTMSRHILNEFWKIQKIIFMCRPIRNMCRHKCSKLEIFWHMWIWDDFGRLNLTHAWIIDERHMHIFFHDLLANNMQTHKCKHGIVKYINHMWRYLKWCHYKHVKWNTQWLHLKFLEMNIHNMDHTHDISHTFEK